MFDLIYVALCCGGISFTITTTSIFKSLREYVGGLHKKLDELIHCPWCLGHWVTVMYLLTFGTIFHPVNKPIADFFINLFIIVSLEGLLHYVLLRAYEPVGGYLVQRKIDSLKKKE